MGPKNIIEDRKKEGTCYPKMAASYRLYETVVQCINCPSFSLVKSMAVLAYVRPNHTYWSASFLV